MRAFRTGFADENREKLGVEVPKQRWPSYFSRIRRLRNAPPISAISFSGRGRPGSRLRSLREDLHKFAFAHVTLMSDENNKILGEISLGQSTRLVFSSSKRRRPGVCHVASL